MVLAWRKDEHNEMATESFPCIHFTPGCGVGMLGGIDYQMKTSRYGTFMEVPQGLHHGGPPMPSATALTRYLIASAQWPCEVDTMVISILQMKKRKSGMAE